MTLIRKSQVAKVLAEYLEENEPRDVQELDECYARERCDAVREIAHKLGLPGDTNQSPFTGNSDDKPH